MNTLDRYVRFAGMKRHGNHAVINWILNLYRGKMTFQNNLHRFDRFDLERIDGIDAFESECREGVRLGEDSDKSVFLSSYEDKPIRKVFNEHCIENYEKAINHDIGRVIHVILLRDPFNYFASRMKGELDGRFVADLRFTNEKDCPKIFQMWKTYAKWFLLFEGSSCQNEVAINYNRWLVSRSYRSQLRAVLGAELHDDEGLNTVTKWGEGSSFSGMVRDKDEEYLSRWKRFSNNPVFVDMFKDDEILAQTVRIFGETLDLAQVRNAILGQ